MNYGTPLLEACIPCHFHFLLIKCCIFFFRRNHAIQNFPEGAIISLPLRAEGAGKGRAFMGGVLSGVVEPIGAVLTILAARLIVPALPYLLSFAAGAMLYVVVEELIPESAQGAHSNVGTITFAIGFAVMMILDVALG